MATNSQMIAAVTTLSRSAGAAMAQEGGSTYPAAPVAQPARGVPQNRTSRRIASGTRMGMMKYVEFEMMLAVLLIAAIATGMFLPSPIVLEMQIHEAAPGPRQWCSWASPCSIFDNNVSTAVNIQTAEADVSSRRD